MKSLAQIPGVRIAAVCDVYEPHLDQARKLADPGAVVSRHYHDILDREGHRRRRDRHPGPLARADDRRRLPRGQGRLCRETADARSLRRAGR